MKYILRSLIFVHRWVGIVLCLIFLLWFPSGIGMMYWNFPGVTADDRLDHSPKLDPSKITLSPTDAAEKLGIQANPTQVRLNSFDGRPVYRFGGGGRGGGGARIIYADTGSEQTEVSSEMLDRIASAWTRQPITTAKKVSVEEPDQWTVAGQLHNLRPMYKYSWPDGQQVYLNGTTGEIVQYTTFAKRVAAHVSAIPHWIYYTPLRTHQPQWLQFMIWSSLIGTIGAILGMIVAVWMYSPKQRYRLDGQPTGIPYRGQKRWHWIFGMVFGVATVTWTFSGLLSLGPFPLVQRLTGTQPRAQQQKRQTAAEQPQQAAADVQRGDTRGGGSQRGAAQPATQRGNSPQAGSEAVAGSQTATPRDDEVTGGERGNPERASRGGGGRRGGRRGGRGGGRGGGSRGRGSRGGDGSTTENQKNQNTEKDSSPAGGNPVASGNPVEGGSSAAGTASNSAGQVSANSQATVQTNASPNSTPQPSATQGSVDQQDTGARGRGQVAATENRGNRNQGGGGGRGGGQQGIAGALRGRVRMGDFASVHPRDLLAKVPNLDVKELEWTSFSNTPLFSANLGDGKSQLLSLDGAPINGFDQQQVIDIVKSAVPDPKAVEIKTIDQYDLYYFDRTRERPLPVLLVLTNDADQTRYYVDPKSARVVTTYNSRNWVNRWLYTGLHSLNFPFLYNHRPLWDIVVITFMVGGTALCVTSLVLAWRTLGRKLKRVAVNDVLSRAT